MTGERHHSGHADCHDTQFRRRCSFAIASLAVALASTCFVQPMFAANTWDAGGADANINTPNNWDDNNSPALTGGGATLTFATGGTNAIINTAVNIAGIVFNRSADFTIATGAGTLTLGSGGITASLPSTTSRTYTITEPVILGANQTWSVGTNGAGSATLAVSAAVSGGFSLAKSGGGRLLVTASNSYSGGTTLNDGILQFGTNSLGTTGAITLNGGTLRWNIGNTQNIFSRVVLTSGSTATLDTNFNSISTEANLGAAGNTASLVKTGGGVLTLTGSTLYTGSTSVAQGTLVFGTSAAKGSGTVTVANDAVLGLRAGAGFTAAEFVALHGGTLSGVSMGSTAVAGIDTNGVNTVITDDLGGTRGIAKMGSGSLTLSGALSYTGPTAIDGGSLSLGSSQSLAGQLRFGSTGGVTTSGTLDLSTTSGTFGSMLVQINSTSGTARAVIGSGQRLAINGNMTVGFDNLAVSSVGFAQTRFAASGAGTFAQTVSGGTFQLGVAAGVGRNPSIADFSGLASLVIDHGTTSGAVVIGEDNTGNGGSQSVLSLAADSTITTNLFHVGRGGNDSLLEQGNGVLRLGTGSNILNANILNVGGTSSGARNSGLLQFQSASGSLRLRAADGTGRATFNLLNSAASTGSTMVAITDLSGHDADLLVGTLTMASRSGGGSGTASFSFDRGTFDATSVVMAQRGGNSTGASTAVMNLGGGATTFGGLAMSVNTSSGAGALASGTLNLTAGSLAIGAGSGTAVNMANAVTGRTATSLISLTGGTASISGRIVRAGGAGTETATVVLDGSRLNMNGFAIGTSAAGIAFDVRSGTLENLGELNGGGLFSKTSSGTLTMSGSSGYTGGTAIDGGLVVATAANALGTGAVSIGSGASLRLAANALVANAITGAGTIEFAGGGIARTSSAGLATALQLVAGDVAAPVALTPGLAWSARIADTTYSDVLDLTNTAGTIQILSLSYDSALLGDVSEADLLLGWRDGTDWVNAIDGNTGIVGGSALTGTSGGYAALGVLPTAAYLGSWGRDTTTKTVWAVVNHNSDYAVIAVPEPTAVALAGVGIAMAAWAMKKRRPVAAVTTP